MAFCTNCGGDVGGFAFCPNCGTRQNDNVQGGYGQSGYVSQNTGKSNTIPMTFSLIGLVSLILFPISVLETRTQVLWYSDDYGDHYTKYYNYYPYSLSYAPIFSVILIIMFAILAQKVRKISTSQSPSKSANSARLLAVFTLVVSFVVIYITYQNSLQNYYYYAWWPDTAGYTSLLTPILVLITIRS